MGYSFRSIYYKKYSLQRSLNSCVILVLSARPSRNDGGDDVSRRGGRGGTPLLPRLVPGGNVRAPRTFTFCLFLLSSLSFGVETGVETAGAKGERGYGYPSGTCGGGGAKFSSRGVLVITSYTLVTGSYTFFIHDFFSAFRIFNISVSLTTSLSIVLQSRGAGGGDGGGTTAADGGGGGGGSVEAPPFFFLVAYLLREVPRLFFL